MYILAIETTGAEASVAIINQSKEISIEKTQGKMKHLQNLIPMIDSLLSRTGIRKEELNYIAVSEGPGSFTGIRIGMATGKGLAQALGINMISIPTLKSFIYYNECKLSGVVCCPVLDARRDQIYSGAYYRDSEGRPTTLIEDGAYDAKTFFEDLKSMIEKDKSFEKVILFGDGIDVYSEVIESFMSLVNGKKAAEEEMYQNASYTAQMAFDALAEGKAIHYLEIEPVYLRKAEAQRKLDESLELVTDQAEPAACGQQEERASTVDNAHQAPSRVTVRTAMETDIDALVLLEKLCFPVPWSRESFVADIVNNDKTIYYVAVDQNSRVIGYAGIWCVLDEGQITNVAVHPDCRQMGIGTRLLESMVRAAENRGAFNQTLEVRESNRNAIGLYKAFGFKVKGLRKNYYRDNGENALLMWRIKSQECLCDDR